VPRRGTTELVRETRAGGITPAPDGNRKKAAMKTWEERHANACRHVSDSRRAIDHQRSIIAKQGALRLNTQASEDLLAAFERSQEIFKGNLARVLLERE
jgi:hypothetical protein